MNYPTGITSWEIDQFENAHQNFVQKLTKNASFDLHINNEEWRNLSNLEQYNLCTKNLQWLIKVAKANDLNLRALGSGWSLSKVGMSEESIINTKRFRHKFTLGDNNFEQGFLDKGNSPENVRFLQCGNTIIDINNHLENESNPPKSLHVSGGSNGQTIVGAFSTNTHGASVYQGSLPDMILGIHVVSDEEKHYYIERASNPVTSTSFHEAIGAELIRDDDLFNAILVSFGSFGIIHGVLVSVEDKFLLEQKLSRVPYNDKLESAIVSGDFAQIEEHFKYPVSDVDHPVYHFEMAINPHDFAFNSTNKGAYIRVMHKSKYYDGYKKIDYDSEGYTYGDDSLGLIQSVLDSVETSFGWLNKRLIPKMVNLLFDTAYDRPEAAIGTIGETFRNTVFRGKLFSAAIGLRREDVPKVIKICLDVNKTHKMAGIMAFRFVKGTKATLGFTKWDNSCVLELDGVDARVNHKFYKTVIAKLESDNISYSIHWGKVNHILNKDRVDSIYGADKVKAWKKQRSRIMNREVQELFNNIFMEKTGLDEYVPWTDNGGPQIT